MVTSPTGHSLIGHRVALLADRVKHARLWPVRGRRLLLSPALVRNIVSFFSNVLERVE